MENCHGQHGWKQFHQNRNDILSEFDRVYAQQAGRPVKTAHGDAVEAHFRKWLSEFLPKKYAVTSGYIIPEIYVVNGSNSQPLYHYDILIYDALEAPILWTEGSYDNSEQGKYRAIPAKHVIAVYEVKSQLTKKSINDSINKLKEVNLYKDQLPMKYHSGVIFIDLKNDNVRKASFLKELHRGHEAHGYIGGMVLRYEGDHSATGLISIFHGEYEDHFRNDAPLAKKIDELDIFLQEDGNLKMAQGYGGVKAVKTTDKSWSVSLSYGPNYVEDNKMLLLSWSRGHFSEFSMRLISLLDGSYSQVREGKKISGFGMVFDDLKKEEAIEQSAIMHPNKPFIKVDIEKHNSSGTPIVEYHDDRVIITYTIKVTNVGSCDVVCSDDGFKSSVTISKGQMGTNEVQLITSALSENDIEKLKNKIEKGKLRIPLRL
ncbi:hypothetical protein QNE85_004242, partial [Vibrio fluvialis]|nr:hypothetical protein [Vibrio fluvialis]